MKKLAVIALLPIYLLVAAGVGINVHYCMGEVEYVVMLGSHGDCCCNEFEDMTGCCEDDIYYQVLEDDQQSSSIISAPAKFQLADVIYSVTVEEIDQSNFNSESNHYTDLPPPESPPIWLTNCSLTYYG